MISSVAVSLLISAPSSPSGDNYANINYTVTYTDAESINLKAADVTLTATGGVTCDPISIINPTSVTPTVSLSGCSGSGVVSIKIKSGSASNSSGSDQGSDESSSAKIFTCPTGYLSVKELSSYSSEAFCVMKYQAKNDGSGNPVSQETSIPWADITVADARAECQSLGAQYDLPTNSEWQALAINLELQDNNWSGGAVGSGCIFQGNSGVNDTCGYNGGQFDTGSGRNPKASLVLGTGEVIWDAAGNVWSWVTDDVQFQYGADDYISKMDSNYGNLGPLGMPKVAFGPSGDYTAHTVTTNYAGIGIGWFTYATGGSVTTARGGDYTNLDKVGIFATLSGYAASFKHVDIGYRCVWHP